MAQENRGNAPLSENDENENPDGGDSSDLKLPEVNLDGGDDVPDQGRIPTEKVKHLDDLSIRRRAHTGDAVVDAGDEAQKRLLRPLSFSRNDDFQGNEGKLSTDADFSRGSGWEGGKLWGEEALGLSSGENTPSEQAAPKGFDLSESQQRNREAIAREGRGDQVPGEPAAQGDLRDQGRDLGRRERKTATQAFGRDVGASGLSGIVQDDVEEAIRRRAAQAHKPDWTAVLGKLGGSSPGSEENLQLSEKFQGVHFPSSREEIIRKLPVDAVFKARMVAIDLREAVAASRLGQFRGMNDLIDCVKDAIREAEKRELRPT